MKTIKLAVNKNALAEGGLVYKVLAVKNSTFPVPGAVLEKSEVDTFCSSNAWDVTIVSLHTS